MVKCEVCNGENFEKYDGFLYCSICQTQSQDYHEQEYEFQPYTTVRRQKSKSTKVKTKEKQQFDDGFWTSWEVFNYILYGMTQEIKKIETNPMFESLVLRIWAAYLNQMEIAFFSHFKEEIPKLGFNFKPRDARVLYNLDVTSHAPVKKKRKKKKKRDASSVSSSYMNYSGSSGITESKWSISLKKSKLAASDYIEYLSMSQRSNTSLADETLESLGRSSESELSVASSSTTKSFLKNMKEVLKKRDYILYRNAMKSDKKMLKAKEKAEKSIKYAGKNKLLSIIHLALLLCNSQIQLSDLLRFIRESHLSFAKVTHFLPRDIKFPKKDSSYVDVISDSMMPTHLRQREITMQLSYLIKLDTIPTPDMTQLVSRYCYDLNLPEQIVNFSLKLLKSCVPHRTLPKAKSLLPSYEAWAMAAIIFVMKLLFGLNGKTEVFLNCLAKEVNRTKKDGEVRLFVFEDWQKYLECRKTVLTEYHYPTEEQLKWDSFESSQKFLGMLTKESKDEFRKERFFSYSEYFIEEKLMTNIKEMLRELTTPQNLDSLEFEPSLTPQTSHIDTILQHETANGKRQVDVPEEVLKKKFVNDKLDYAFDPSQYLDVVKQSKNEFLVKLCGGPGSDLSFNSKWPQNLLLHCRSKYWIFPYPSATSGHLSNFKKDIFEKTSENFRWLLTECARMLEMNVRDVYDELLKFENFFVPRKKKL